MDTEAARLIADTILQASKNPLAFPTLVISLFAAIFALIPAVFVVFQQRLNEKAGDASLILQSAAEYEAMFEDIASIREAFERHEEFLLSLNVDHYSESAFELVNNYTITKDEWKGPRRVKNFYKSRYNLEASNIFSKPALAISMDRGAAEILSRMVRPMDVFRFYSSRMRDFQEGKTKGFAEIFELDMCWYAELDDFVSRYRPTHPGKKRRRTT